MGDEFYFESNELKSGEFLNEKISQHKLSTDSLFAGAGDDEQVTSFGQTMLISGAVALLIFTILCAFYCCQKNCKNYIMTLITTKNGLIFLNSQTDSNPISV